MGSKEVFRKPYERGVNGQARFHPFALVYRKRLGTVWDELEGPFLLHWEKLRPGQGPRLTQS